MLEDRVDMITRETCLRLIDGSILVVGDRTAGSIVLQDTTPTTIQHVRAILAASDTGLRWPLNAVVGVEQGHAKSDLPHSSGQPLLDGIRVQALSTAFIHSDVADGDLTQMNGLA
jgi:hypothetical protein